MADTWVLNDIAPAGLGAQFETPASEGAWGWFGVTPGVATAFQAPAVPWAYDFSVPPAPMWTAEAGGQPQSVDLGVASETDTANAIAPVAGGVTVAIGAAVSGEAALAITPVAGAVSVVLGAASEADAANAITPVAGGVVVAIGVAVSGEAALSITPVAGVVAVAMGTATEADTANAITPSSPSSAALVYIGLWKLGCT